mgnify:CR=1 FL=1
MARWLSDAAGSRDFDWQPTLNGARQRRIGNRRREIENIVNCQRADYRIAMSKVCESSFLSDRVGSMPRETEQEEMAPALNGSESNLTLRTSENHCPALLTGIGQLLPAPPAKRPAIVWSSGKFCRSVGGQSLPRWLVRQQSRSGHPQGSHRKAAKPLACLLPLVATFYGSLRCEENLVA